MQATRDRYIEESNWLSTVRAEFTDVSSLNTDGISALVHARQRERRAIHEYIRVLKIFSDLLVRGVVPEEEA